MAVVQVGRVRVGVAERLVAVRVGVRLGDGAGVVVAVVLVVDVEVLVLDGLMHVEVGVPVADEQRDPGGHQRGGGGVARGEALP